MAINFILSLPREVRDQIYINALSSLTGYIPPLIRSTDQKHFALVPFEPPHNLQYGRIRLSLLQTCKQIYQEARDVLYEQNTWGVLSPFQLLYEFRELNEGLGHRVRNIWLGVNLADRHDLKDTARALEVLSRWAHRAGNLRNITLNVATGKTDMHELMDLRRFGEPDAIHSHSELNPNVEKKLFQEYIKVLRNSWGKYDGQWAGVKRKLELRIEQLYDHSVYEPRELIAELHDAFGGELWIDGRLCYRDGIEVLQPFQPCRGWWQIAWFREDDDRFWGR